MGLDGGRSIGMPKSSSQKSSKSEFSDSEFVFGGLNLTVVLTWEREAERGILIWGGDSDLGVERGIWGWGSLPIFPSKESCGREWKGISIAGEPAHCGEGDLGVGIFAYFAKEGEF